MSAWVWLPIFLILINGTFVLIEYSLLRVRPSRLEILARRGSAAAKIAQEMQARFDYYLAAIQVGLILTALALGRLGEPIVAAWVQEHFPGAVAAWLGPRWDAAIAFISALAALAFVMSVFGELLPRAVALRRAEAVALWGAYPLRIFAGAFRPAVSLMTFSSRGILKLLGLSGPASSETSLSAEEMRVLIGETQEKGALALEQLFLLENLFDFGKAVAADAMVPREKIAALSLAEPWPVNLGVIRARRFSRYPIYESDLDSTLGLVHVKDVFLTQDGSGPPDLRRLKRELMSVSETESLEKLVKILPDRGVHMALVRNALGRVAGLITLEDIIEELVGEVHDEFDLPQAWSFMDVVSRKSVAVHLQAADRAAAVRRVMSLLEKAHPGIIPADALSAVLEREGRLSSCIGRGVAVPHARLASMDRGLVAVGRFHKPVDFGGDKGPVRLVFLALTPSSHPVLQIRILSRIASLVANENLRRKLLHAPSAESLFDILRTADTMLAD